MRSRQRSEEHTSELQSHRDLHSFPTRRSSDLSSRWPLFYSPLKAAEICFCRSRSARAMYRLDAITPIDTTKIVSAATAFTRGSRPSRAREKITIGIVDEPGPDKKADSTTSSSDSVNVSSHADASACVMFGSVTRKNTWRGLQPKSIAASSSDLLISCKRDCTTTVA